MSLELGLQIFVGGLLLFIGWQIVRALRRRQWGTGRRAYRRDEEPAEFWFHLIWALLMGATFVWLIATPPDSLRASGWWRVTFLIFFGIPAAFWLVRSLQTGSAGFGDLSFGRREEPGRFWLLMLAHAAVVAISLWAASGWGSPRPDVEEVEPVLAAARGQAAPGVTGS